MARVLIQLSLNSQPTPQTENREGQHNDWLFPNKVVIRLELTSRM